LAAKPNSYLRTVGTWRLLLSLALQLLLGFFMAHGYDYRVSYVAGLNVSEGRSPYIGGLVDGFLSLWYGRDVQGLGETPFWALYTGVSYILSGGDIYIFNFVLKIPVIGCNFILSYLAVKRGCDPYFFLLNPFTLLISASWGKPDNIATLISIIPLLLPSGLLTASLLFSISLMVKPLSLPILPALISKYTNPSRVRAIILMALTLLLSLTFFISPFIIFGWPIQTVLGGAGNWFKSAGGISPYSIVEALTGDTILPESLVLLGYAPLAAVTFITILAFIRQPSSAEGAILMALTTSALFLSLRSWVSEQNLYIILTLMIFALGRLPSRLFWIIPTIFAAVNLSIFQNLYLVAARTFVQIPLVDMPLRLWIKFLISIAWLATLWRTMLSGRLYRW